MPRNGSLQRRQWLKTKDLQIGTWTMRTLFKTGSLKSLQQQLQKYKISIAANQETKWTGNDIYDTKTHTIFKSGRDKGNREFGVAFIVNRDMKSNVLAFTPIDERICVLQIKTSFF